MRLIDLAYITCSPIRRQRTLVDNSTETKRDFPNNERRGLDGNKGEKESCGGWGKGKRKGRYVC